MSGVIVIGVVARTGSAVAIAVGGPAVAPLFRARQDITLVPAWLPAQPYHAAAGMDPAAAERLIAQVESAAEQAAARALRILAAALPDGPVRGVAVVVRAVSVPQHLGAVLRSHAWMHAAEGILYRRAVLAAAVGCGLASVAVDQSALPHQEDVVAGLGRAAGRPWRRSEKDATRAAITLLTSADPPDRPVT